MEIVPSEGKIREWIIAYNPLGLFNETVQIQDIDPKQWSGHFNFLLSCKDKKFVLRFKGPEWGSQKGIENEYTTLKSIESYSVGPKVYYLTEDFFGELAIVMEYIDGVIFTMLNGEEQERSFVDVAQFIVHVSQIPIRTGDLQFEESMESYEKSKKAWRTRLGEIRNHPDLVEVANDIGGLLPQLEERLSEYEPLLKKVITKHGTSFIFESAHAGHLMKVKDGFRFLNWEQVSFGDPSFMLAVFLSSIRNREDFDEIKNRMVHECVRMNHIETFEALLDQRLWERAVSNPIYKVWKESQKNEKAVDVAMAREQVVALKTLSKILH